MFFAVVVGSLVIAIHNIIFFIACGVLSEFWDCIV